VSKMNTLCLIAYVPCIILVVWLFVEFNKYLKVNKHLRSTEQKLGIREKGIQSGFGKRADKGTHDMDMNMYQNDYNSDYNYNDYNDDYSNIDKPQRQTRTQLDNDYYGYGSDEYYSREDNDAYNYDYNHVHEYQKPSEPKRRKKTIDRKQRSKPKSQPTHKPRQRKREEEFDFYEESSMELQKTRKRRTSQRRVGKKRGPGGKRKNISQHRHDAETDGSNNEDTIDWD